jgi:hypothetical protein
MHNPEIPSVRAATPHRTERSLSAPLVRRTLRIQARSYADVASIAE